MNVRDSLQHSATPVQGEKWIIDNEREKICYDRIRVLGQAVLEDSIYFDEGSVILFNSIIQKAYDVPNLYV